MKIFRFINSRILKAADFIHTAKITLKNEACPLKLLRSTFLILNYIPIFPYHLIREANGRCTAKAYRGLYRTVTLSLITVLIFLRAGYTACRLLPRLGSSIILFQDGGATMDFCILLILSLMGGIIGITILVLFLYETEVEQVINFSNDISTRVAGKLYGNANLLGVFRGDITVWLYSLIFAALIVIIPLANTILVFLLGLKSPFFLIHDLVEYLPTPVYFHPLFWAAALFDIVFTSAALYLVILVAAIAYETFLQCILALREIRCGLVENKLTWKDVHELLTQLEMAIAGINIVGYYVVPLALLISFYFSVIAAVLFLRIRPGLLGNLPIEVAYPQLVAYFFGAMLPTCRILRMSEELAAQSESIMEAFKTVAAATGIGGPDGERCGGAMISRRWKRRPLRLKIWFLMTVEDGMTFDFVQSVFDNVLTGIMMVNVNVPPQLL